MIYFSKETLNFLTSLAKNNDREWFNMHKEDFISQVKLPFELFISDLIEALQPHFKLLTITPKDAIFRIYRDVRFSKDKSPYKTKVSALVTPGGRKDRSSPGLYIEINGKEARVYSGLYQLSSKQLRNVRTHISYNLETFHALVTNKSFLQTFGEVRGEKNKRIPKEFEEDSRSQPLLFNKSFYYFSMIPSQTVLSPELINKVVQVYLVAKPLSTFLYEGLDE